MSSRRGVFLILGLILFASMVSIVGVFVLSLAASPVPSVPSNASLFLPLRAPFDEIESFDMFSIVRRAPTLRETLAGIRKAKNDARVKSLVIRPETSGALWAQLQELRAVLEEFKGAGKPLTAFLEAGTAQDYYVASAADRIVMMPAGQLDLSGLAT